MLQQNQRCSDKRLPLVRSLQQFGPVPECGLCHLDCLLF